jgi:hypothetical protein
MKKFLFLSMVMLSLMLFSTKDSCAIELGFAPLSQDVLLGNTANVKLVISGLGDMTAPSLSTFDLDVTFNPSILSFNSVSYGDSVLGDQLDLLGLGTLTTTTPGTGILNLMELSFDDPDTLNNLQAGSFTLATLTFDTIALGSSPLGLSINALGDAWGDPLYASAAEGGINVVPNVVPEPSTLALLGSGLIGITFLRKRFW